MKKLLIRFNTIEDVRRFVDVAAGTECSIELSQGSYSVDGKSIMGIFGLDLKETVTVCVSGDGSAGVVDALAQFAASKS